ncbi:hypothetical protein DFH27DRAFT_599446 [Peziza echinospora]|nr:hypothetical protein DFH27DRAFT_599446 [Peziza echinospora]
MAAALRQSPAALRCWRLRLHPHAAPLQACLLSPPPTAPSWPATLAVRGKATSAKKPKKQTKAMLAAIDSKPHLPWPQREELVAMCNGFPGLITADVDVPLLWAVLCSSPGWGETLAQLYNVRYPNNFNVETLRELRRIGRKNTAKKIPKVVRFFYDFQGKNYQWDKDIPLPQEFARVWQASKWPPALASKHKIDLCARWLKGNMEWTPKSGPLVLPAVNVVGLPKAEPIHQDPEERALSESAENEALGDFAKLLASEKPSAAPQETDNSWENSADLNEESINIRKPAKSGKKSSKIRAKAFEEDFDHEPDEAWDKAYGRAFEEMNKRQDEGEFDDMSKKEFDREFDRTIDRVLEDIAKEESEGAVDEASNKASERTLQPPAKVESLEEFENALQTRAEVETSEESILPPQVPETASQNIVEQKTPNKSTPPSKKAKSAAEASMKTLIGSTIVPPSTKKKFRLEESPLDIFFTAFNCKNYTYKSRSPTTEFHLLKTQVLEPQWHHQRHAARIRTTGSWSDRMKLKLFDSLPQEDAATNEAPKDSYLESKEYSDLRFKFHRTVEKQFDWLMASASAETPGKGPYLAHFFGVNIRGKPWTRERLRKNLVTRNVNIYDFMEYHTKLLVPEYTLTGDRETFLFSNNPGPVSHHNLGLREPKQFSTAMGLAIYSQATGRIFSGKEADRESNLALLLNPVDAYFSSSRYREVFLSSLDPRDYWQVNTVLLVLEIEDFYRDERQTHTIEDAQEAIMNTMKYGAVFRSAHEQFKEKKGKWWRSRLPR